MSAAMDGIRQVDENPTAPGVLAGRKVLMIVENLPVPFDRRVWQEARTLRDAGALVSVICPAAKGYTARYEQLEGIHIYRHPLPMEAKGALGFLLEYSAALFHEAQRLGRDLLVAGQRFRLAPVAFAAHG